MKKIPVVLIGTCVVLVTAYLLRKEFASEGNPTISPQPQLTNIDPKVALTESELHERMQQEVSQENTGVKDDSNASEEANTIRRAQRIHVDLVRATQEQLDKAAREFEIFLKEREAGYPTIVPEQGMISVSNALDIATAYVNNQYDKNQKPKIELENDIYRVTLWGLRRPILSATGFSAIVDVDAWSGEVVYFLISAD